MVNHSNLRNDFGEATSENHSQDKEQDRENAIYLVCEENLIKEFAQLK